MHFDTHAQGARIQHIVGQAIPLGTQHHESTLIVQSHVTHRHGVGSWGQCDGGDSVGRCSANELGGVGNSCMWYVERVAHRHSKCTSSQGIGTVVVEKQCIPTHGGHVAGDRPHVDRVVDVVGEHSESKPLQEIIGIARLGSLEQ